ncbi:MAG: acylneuraminate cytidylyltransferase family protein [Candidatus Omnitrophota bacterium]|nr:acylneuraminate cytidylyltransferase family protein [Candidatus Omnitrophota bacterium]
MKIIGLITARGGSKSIPGKNIKILAGKPLIAWTIEAALKCKGLSRVIVSTNDEKIAKVSKRHGAEVPFRRPGELSKNESPHISVVLHAIDWLKKHEACYPDYIMLLQPTSPFRTTEDMENVIKLAKNRNTLAVVSVCEIIKYPYKTHSINKKRSLEYFIPPNDGYMYRQALPELYEQNGAIYLNTCSSLLKQRTFVPKGAVPYIMPQERSLDIDTAWDFHVAELVLKNKKRR